MSRQGTTRTILPGNQTRHAHGTSHRVHGAPAVDGSDRKTAWLPTSQLLLGQLMLQLGEKRGHIAGRIEKNVETTIERVERRIGMPTISHLMSRVCAKD